ncbi:MAG: hypothetical protein R3E96_12385 [Planctomycetota bacterium]
MVEVGQGGSEKVAVLPSEIQLHDRGRSFPQGCSVQLVYPVGSPEIERNRRYTKGEYLPDVYPEVADEVWYKPERATYEFIAPAAKYTVRVIQWGRFKGRVQEFTVLAEAVCSGDFVDQQMELRIISTIGICTEAGLSCQIAAGAVVPHQRRIT